MKKLGKVQVVLLLILGVIFVSSCSNLGKSFYDSMIEPASNKSALTAEQTLSLSEFAQENPEVSAKVEPVLMRSLENLIDESDYIIIATVTDILPAFTVSADHKITDAFSGLGCTNYTPYLLTVDQVISGDAAVNETIRIDLMGGEASGVKFTCSPIAYPEINTTYLMFLQDFDWVIEHDLEYNRIVFTGSYDGFYKVDENKLFPNVHSTLIPVGTSLQDVIEIIKDRQQFS